MTYTVSVTSQGQVSIPAKIRRELGLDKPTKALVSMEEGRVVIEPVKDLLELRGSLTTKMKATPSEIREAFETYLAEKVAKKSNA